MRDHYQPVASCTALSLPFQRFAAGLHEHRKPTIFIQHLLSGLQHLIPSDYNSWMEIIYSKPPKVAAVFSPQNPQATSILPVFPRHIKDQPVCRYWRESGHYHIATRWSDVADWTTIERTPLYTEFYRPLGVRHHMMVALQAKPSHLIYLTLNRSQTPFSEQDRDLLTALQPHASCALQSIHGYHSLQSTMASYSAFVDTFSQGIVCLSPDFHIRWANKRARTDLHAHFGWPPNSTRLPEELQKRLPRGQTVAASPGSFSIQSRAGSLFIRTLKTQKDFYLFLQGVEQQPAFDALKTFGLTNREAEVLGWIAKGKSNDEAAAILGIGPQTVKKHLERIYSVLGVANRTEAALKANAMLGAPASP